MAAAQYVGSTACRQQCAMLNPVGACGGVARIWTAGVLAVTGIACRLLTLALGCGAGDFLCPQVAGQLVQHAVNVTVAFLGPKSTR